MKKIAVCMLVVVFTISIMGCSLQNSSLKNKDSGKTDKVKSNEEILKTINDSISALNNKDLNKYMSYIDTDSVEYDDIKVKAQSNLKNYSLNFKLVEAQILSKSNEEIQVQIIQAISRTAGAKFKDNKELSIQYLKKTFNGWRISKVDVQKVEYVEPIYNDIYNSIDAASDKNITGYMGVFDQTNSDFYNKIKDAMQDSFNQYDIKFNLEDSNITNKTDKDTTVEYTLTSIKKRESDYKNNKIKGVYHFRKINDQWKVFKIDIKSTEQLDDKLIAK